MPHAALSRTCAKLCRAGEELEQIQMLLGHQSVPTTERYLGQSRIWSMPPMMGSSCEWRYREPRQFQPTIRILRSIELKTVSQRQTSDDPESPS